jgi:hypothetical protein
MVTALTRGKTMAHFAKLGVGNIIEAVHVVSNDVALNEQTGIDFLNNLYNTRDVWKQTSYNNNIRKNYAGVGYSYDEVRDAFIPPKPYLSWVLNEDSCQWDAPVAYPEDEKHYTWDEENQQWVELIGV